MLHGAFVAVDQEVAGVEVLGHVFQLLDDRIRRADDDYPGLLLVLVRQGVSHVAGEHACGTAPLDLQGLPRLVTGRVHVFSRAPLPVAFGPDEVPADLLGFLLGIRYQDLE